MKLLLVLLFNISIFINLFLTLKNLNKGINFVFSVAICLLASSLLYFFSLLSGVGLILSLGVGTVLVLSLLIFKIHKNKLEIIQKNQIIYKLKKTDLLLVFVCLYAFLLFINRSQKWGLWDAWAIWSLHAEFLFSPEDWKNLFDPALNWSHSDYPLFLPSLIALLWNTLGEISSLIPFVVGFIPYFLIIIFFYFVFENKLIGIICILLSISDPGFVSKAASQYADTYLSLFILMSYFGLIQSSKTSQNNIFPVIVGIISSGTMWIKNEGFAFYIIFSILWMFTFINNRKKLLYYASGSFLIIFTVVLFKFLLAPPNDVISSNGINYFEKIRDIDRILLIYRYFRDYLLFSVPIITFVIIASIFSKSKLNILIASSILLLFASYFTVYILSPYEVEWHLETSFDRLVHQLTPLILFLYVPKLAELFPKAEKL